MENFFILILLSAVYATLFIYCFAEYHRRADNKTKSVYLPKYIFWIGVVTGGAFLIIAWLAADQDGSVGLTICFGFFALLGMSLMLGWKNCFITYDKVGFTQKNFIGMLRNFTYDQVTAWCINKRNPMESSLYANGKKISFNLISQNGPDFLVTVSAGYRKTHGNKNMPELPALRKERGGFRAHVYNPGEYLAIFIMLLVFIVGLGTWSVIDGLMPIDENDCDKYILTFSSWKIEGQSMVLSAPQIQESFIINGYEDYLSGIDQLIEKCDSKTTFTVWADRFDPDDADSYYRVYALSSGEEVYRTFEDSTAYKREEIPFSIGIFSIFLVILLAFSTFIYIVGSYPQRFPKWVVYFCFKKDAIDI